MKKTNTIPVIVAFFKMVIAIAVCIYVFNRNERIRELESRQPVIIYQVDNAGAEMIGKVTAKDVLDGHYYVEVKPYGKFLVTKEQYEEIEIGQEMPEYLKGRGS
ncbi:DUF1372 family protein [Streptococcus suis]|uniref:Phage protein n=1 Tax=Streptococcus suis TaxID=1307 RepID=A0A0Z8GSY8_STRSU|nr:DUF1372 family protein [Streptococcus suis]NQH79302.1 DUF1372 family protein [Streptococcus suis]CYV04344.1 phage protein [Streptococcus suis]